MLYIKGGYKGAIWKNAPLFRLKPPNRPAMFG